MRLETECERRGNRSNQVVYRTSAEVLRRDGRTRAAKKTSAGAREQRTPGDIVRRVGQHRTRYYVVDDKRVLRTVTRAAAEKRELEGARVVTEYRHRRPPRGGSKPAASSSRPPAPL